MPLDQWVLSVFWQGKVFLLLFFCRASSKANLKYWYIKEHKISICLGSICGSREIMFHVKLV